MIPTYMNSSSPPFPFDLNYNGDQYDDDQNPKLCFTSNYHQANSSSSSSHLFLNQTWDQHHYYYQPHQPNAIDNCGSYDKKEEKYENQADDYDEKNNQEKWILPRKIKLVKKKVECSSDATATNMIVTNTNNVTAAAIMKLEDTIQKGASSSSLEITTDHSSNSSNNGGNTIVRVCADCNTTKTPLWRSGPNGPKSLCNACGIRQRKARRAKAAAAAAAASTIGTNETPQSLSTSTLKIKVQQKEKTVKKKKNINVNDNLNNQKPFKKRCRFAAPATTELQSSRSCEEAKNKHSFEELLKKLSNNLAIQRVFPEDEKDAAILLMAISCGLVHG